MGEYYLACCKGDWGTRLQENPQRLGWGSWRDVLHYILGLHSKCQGLCDWSYTSVFKYYFSNTWTGLGCSRVLLCSLGVEIELSPYTTWQHDSLLSFPFKETISCSSSNLWTSSIYACTWRQTEEIRCQGNRRPFCWLMSRIEFWRMEVQSNR